MCSFEVTITCGRPRYVQTDSQVIFALEVENAVFLVNFAARHFFPGGDTN